MVVEGVYSMDGDICTLPEILEVTKRHGARILIDEAHSTFLFGPNGRGVAEHFGLDKEVDFHLGTFSKSLGGQGGFVAGSKDLIDYVNAFARSRFFSCNLSPVLTAGLLAGLRIAAAEPQLRAKLWSNCAYLRRRFAEEGVDIGKSNSQVMPVMVNNDARVLVVAEKIQDRGLFLNPVTYPAVPKHKSRLRISVSAAHTEQDLEDRGADDRRRPPRGGSLSITRYGYRDAISGFFEFPTDNARRILPRGFEPVEPHHSTSILAITVFDFDQSEVGEYGEVVYAVIVPPLVRDTRLPKSAFFPWQVATTTKAAREHAIERWHLPHWMEDVEVAFERGQGKLTARVKADGSPAPRADGHRPLVAGRVAPVPVVPAGRERDSTSRTSCSRATRASTRRRAGSLVLHDNVFNKDIVRSEVYEKPFRELWMRSGCQLFDPLDAAAALGGRPVRPRAWTSPSSSSSTRAPARAVVRSSWRRCSRASRAAARVEHALTREPGDEARLAREAIERGFACIVAVGGDGTWSNVGNAILQSGKRVKLALVPGGTGCDLAKTLGIPPRDVQACCRIVLAGRTRTIDVGRIEDRHFLNIAGFGYDVAVLEDSWSVGYLEGSALYLYCALRQLHSYRGFELEAEADGRALGRHDMLMVIVANARVFGGGFQVAPGADVEDGLLNAVSFANMGLGVSRRRARAAAPGFARGPPAGQLARRAPARLPLRGAAGVRDGRRVEPGPQRGRRRRVGAPGARRARPLSRWGPTPPGDP